MFKSQLEATPQNFEATAIFVENIFDKIKKKRAESKLSPDGAFDFGFPEVNVTRSPPKSRKNVKKSPKLKKTTSPKKKTASKKPRVLKERLEKQKKTTTPNKSPRKYTRRVAKVPAAADIDDEEAAFILSSISQRSFDSFYSRQTSGDNKINIPLDGSNNTSESYTSSSKPAHNLAYYVMLDHNYWVVAPEVKQTPEKKPSETVQNNITFSLSLTQTIPEAGALRTLVQSKEVKIAEKEEGSTITKISGLNGISENTAKPEEKQEEVNNNTFTPNSGKEIFIKDAHKVENTAVKKRWLRQAATDLKTPLKKRMNMNFQEEIAEEKGESISQTDQKARCEAIEPQPEEIMSAKKDLLPLLIAAKRKEIKIEDVVAPKIRILAQAYQPNKKPKIEVEMPLDVSSQTISLIKSEPDSITEEKVKELCEEDKVQDLKVEDLKVEEPKIEEPKIEEPEFKASKDETPKVELETSKKEKLESLDEPLQTISSPPKNNEMVKKDKTLTELKDFDEEHDENDERHWEVVMEFHRLQLKRLTKANKRFAESSRKYSTDSKTEQYTTPILSEFAHVERFHSSETRLNSNRLPPVQNRLSPLDKLDYVDPRRSLSTSLSLETHQNPLNIVPPFQRSISETTLADTRNNRWGGNEVTASYNTFKPYTTFYNENTHQKEEPYLRSSYSAYKVQKSSWIKTHNQDSVDAAWNHHAIVPATNFTVRTSLPFPTTAETVVKKFDIVSIDENISTFIKKNITPTAVLAKTKTSVFDPRLNPSLNETRKDDTTPKKKLSLDQYRKRVSLTSIISSTSGDENSVVSSPPAFDPLIAEAAVDTS